MFEERYRKLYQDVAPTEELSQETVELMIEARNHRAKPLPEQKSKLPMILWLSAAGALAAAFIATVSVLAFINRGSNIDELLGDMTLTQQDTETTAKPEPLPEGNAGATEQETEDVLAPEIAVLPSDRFTSFDDYFKALDGKKTLGYGKNYYLCKEMVVYPKALPKGAKLVEILQYEDGQYQYSYRFTQNKESYILTVRSQSTFPTSEEAMEAQLELLKKEEAPTFIAEGNSRTYRFGKLDAIIVTVDREIFTETPKDETSKGETPKDETSKGETPKDETSKDETPKDETPKDETPKDETSKGETPKDETPVPEPPADENPVAEAAEIAAMPAIAAAGDTAADSGASVEGSAGQSTEPYDPDASVSSPVQPAPLTQKEVDALLKNFELVRYLNK